MDLGLLLQPQGIPPAFVEHELAACNEASSPYGLSLTSEQMLGLVQRRFDALRETQRIEFGHGILRELVSAFASSPYLASESYDETLAELQDLFYRLKEETEERVSDTDLVDAMRVVFDEDACGAIELMETVPAQRLFAAARRAGQDQDEDWSEDDAYEKGGEEGAPGSRNELDRVREQGVWDRPGNEYAATFYDGSREVYRITADKNARIGGSSLG
ncbi:MAG: DUF6323 family protein [Eggerthellaceae bacterium]|nr:DUF6323 family protein [Eggerthellaceae bacterium]